MGGWFGTFRRVILYETSTVPVNYLIKISRCTIIWTPLQACLLTTRQQNWLCKVNVYSNSLNVLWHIFHIIDLISTLKSGARFTKRRKFSRRKLRFSKWRTPGRKYLYRTKLRTVLRSWQQAYAHAHTNDKQVDGYKIESHFMLHLCWVYCW